MTSFRSLSNFESEPDKVECVRRFEPQIQVGGGAAAGGGDAVGEGGGSVGEGRAEGALLQLAGLQELRHPGLRGVGKGALVSER